MYGKGFSVQNIHRKSRLRYASTTCFDICLCHSFRPISKGLFFPQ